MQRRILLTAMITGYKGLIVSNPKTKAKSMCSHNKAAVKILAVGKASKGSIFGIFPEFMCLVFLFLTSEVLFLCSG